MTVILALKFIFRQLRSESLEKAFGYFRRVDHFACLPAERGLWPGKRLQDRTENTIE